MRGPRTYLKLGDWNTVCYQCGFKRKASELVRNWQGYRVCPEHNEPRQPQDFVRAVPDIQAPPWTQPMPSTQFTYVNVQIGVGDSVTRAFQLGDGLYLTTVTAVYVDGVATQSYTTNSYGLITLNSPPTKGQIVTASGSEIAP